MGTLKNFQQRLQINQRVRAFTSVWNEFLNSELTTGRCILAVSLLIVVYAGFQILDLPSNYNVRQFFPRVNPLMRQDEILTQKFKLGDSSPFLIVASLQKSPEDWSVPAYLEAVKSLVASIEKIPDVQSVKALTNIQGAVMNQGTLGIGLILDYLNPLNFKKEIRKNPVLSPYFISQDAKILTIVVLPETKDGRINPDLGAALLRESEHALPFAEVNLGGVPAIQSDVNTIIQKEVLHFIAISALISLIALSLIFSNVWPILVCCVLALCTNILSLWGISLAGFTLSILSSSIPILVTMTVLSIALHSILRLIERSHQNNSENGDSSTPKSHVELVKQTFRELLRPNALTALTTSVGFFALAISDAPAIRDFGISVGIGLLCTTLATAVLLPALLALSPQPKLRSWMSGKARWSLQILKFHRLALVTVVILTILGGWRGQYLSWTARLFDDLPSDHSVRKTTEMVDQSLGGLVPLEIEIRLPKVALGNNLTASQNLENPWSEESLVQSLDKLENNIRALRGVGSVMSVPDIFKASGLKSGKNPVSSQEIMFLLSMSSDNPLEHFLSADGKSVRLSIRLKDIPGFRMWHLVQEIKKLSQTSFPGFKIRAAGTAAYVHDINNALSKDLLYGFWQAMVVIGILLIISYRSFLWALLACLPNLAPPALLLGILSVTKVSIKPGIAIVLSISLGLAFNNTVYLLERLRQTMAQGVSTQKSLARTFWSEGNACFFSSMVLVFGFGSFAISYFKMNQLFGIFMILSVLTGMIGDLIMLPALLKFLFEKFPLAGIQLAPMRTTTSKIIISILIGAFTFLLAILAPSKSSSEELEGALTLESLAQKMEASARVKDETGKISMHIIESDGSEKKRDLSFSRMEAEHTHFVLIRLESPQDMKGTALLSVLQTEAGKASEEQKWIYLPTSKQTRKIATSEGNSRVLDSELYSQDLELENVQKSNSVLKPSADSQSYNIETVLKDEKSPYSKTSSIVNAQGLLQKVDAFDKKGKLLKHIDFLNYKKLGDHTYRATEIDIENLQNKRKTKLMISSLKINQKLTEKSFTPAALSD